MARLRRRLFAKTWRVPEGTTYTDGSDAQRVRGLTVGPDRWTYSQRQNDILVVLEGGTLVSSGFDMIRSKMLFGQVEEAGYGPGVENMSRRFGGRMRALACDPRALYREQDTSPFMVPGGKEREPALAR